MGQKKVLFCRREFQFHINQAQGAFQTKNKTKQKSKKRTELKLHEFSHYSVSSLSMKPNFEMKKKYFAV